METLSHCFDVHNFNELNNIDYGLLWKVVDRAIQKNSEIIHSGIFFDVGTNAGSFVKVLQSFNITKNIHCFEPHPFLSEKVITTYPFVRMNKVCLSEKEEEVVIYMPKYSCGLSSLINRPIFTILTKDGQPVIEYRCPSQTLDSYCLLNNIQVIDFIKIDIEGGEKRMFDGAIRMLSENRIKAGIFEAGQTSIDAGTSEEELVAVLCSFGYTCSKEFSKSDIYFYLN